MGESNAEGYAVDAGHIALQRQGRSGRDAGVGLEVADKRDVRVAAVAGSAGHIGLASDGDFGDLGRAAIKAVGVGLLSFAVPIAVHLDMHGAADVCPGSLENHGLIDGADMSFLA